MTQLSTKIKLYANKEVDFRNEVKLQDDGNGAFINNVIACCVLDCIYF